MTNNADCNNCLGGASKREAIGDGAGDGVEFGRFASHRKLVNGCSFAHGSINNV